MGTTIKGRSQPHQFYTGNVIEDPHGNKWIVTDCDDKVVSAVSFDSENMLAIQKLEDHSYTQMCPSCEYDMDDCDRCGGTGRIVVAVKGWKHSTVLARTVKDFILMGVKKQFGL